MRRTHSFFFQLLHLTSQPPRFAYKMNRQQY